jgi:hypothetical protein
MAKMQARKDAGGAESETGEGDGEGTKAEGSAEEKKD